jgi:hypothetical protein
MSLTSDDCNNNERDQPSNRRPGQLHHSFPRVLARPRESMSSNGFMANVNKKGIIPRCYTVEPELRFASSRLEIP